MAKSATQMRRSPFLVWTPLCFVIMIVLEACATPQSNTLSASGNPDDLLIVDCLLPPQIRQLGTRITYLSPRRPIKTSAARCEIDGGEYVAFDRADAGTSLKIWLPQAEDGDPQAQTYVGEIFEKGLGVEPDYPVAARWYRKASVQGFTRALINLGYLYESGLGVTQDLSEAMNLYRQASGIEDGTLEYVSTVEFARRETAKRDAVALQTQVGELAQRLADSEARYRVMKDQVRSDQAELKALAEQTRSKRQEMAAQYRSESAGEAPETARALIEIDIVRGQLASELSSNESMRKQLDANRDEIRSLRQGLVADSQQVEQLKGQLAEQVNLITILQAALESPSDGRDRDETREALEVARGSAALTRQSVSDLRQYGNEVPDSVLDALAEAEERELVLTSVLAKRTESLSALRRQQAELESQYRESIGTLQTELNLSQAEQTRVAGRLADTELSKQNIHANNKQLQDRLREQNANVVNSEREQQRLTAKVAALAMSEQVSQAEKRAAEASTRVADAELALARFEQSRLVTKLVEAQLTSQQDKLNTAEQLAILEKQLAIQTGVVENRRQQISVLEDGVTEGRAQSQSTPAEAVAQVVAIGPTIEIIDPPVLVTRGPGEITTRADGAIDLVGRVSPADRLLTFSINGQRQAVNSSGVFNFRSTQTMNRLELTAVDEAGERASVSFSVTRHPPATDPNQVPVPNPGDSQPYGDIKFGRYHAIVIGNNRYDDMSDLRTAETDARVIDALLRENYGFSTQLLINATRLEMLTAFNTTRETLTDEDNLIVYYAGHGQLDPDGERGYWLPVDANVNNSEHWISNAVVTNYLDSIPARQIMVVADSCFSGTLTKASIPRMQKEIPAALRTKWLSLMATRKVRTVLSSGGVKPVYDGTAKHSLFASAFIDQLSRNRGVLEGYRLYSDIRQDVQRSAIALGVEQLPQYAAIKHAGHEAGEFLFVAR